MSWILTARQAASPLLRNCQCVSSGMTNTLRALNTFQGRSANRTVNLSYSKSMHLRRSLTPEKSARIFGSPFHTSQQTFDSDERKKLQDHVRDDPETKEYLKEITKDFHLHEDMDNANTESDSSVNIGNKESSPPEIVVKSEYVIMQDDMVYDYEELDDNYEELEEETDEVHLPISLERGITGVFDLSELINLLNHENAVDLCAISIPEEIQYVDYLVIVSGRSVRHCRAIASSVKWFFKQRASRKDAKSVNIEGLEGSQWLAMDLGNIALHIFMPQERLKYDLESLWTVGPEFDENVQKEKAPQEDPFEQYLRDFGQKGESDTDTEISPKRGPRKKVHANVHNMESAVDWHSQGVVKNT